MIAGLSASSAFAMDYLKPYPGRAGSGVSAESRNIKAAAEDSGADPAVSGEKASQDSVGEPAGTEASGSNGGLSEEEQRQVDELARTDRRVRQHEQAHMAAGGALVTSGASYEYETGPDGKRYAVGGEVGISLSEGRTPEETVQRARQIRAAALAPGDPSPQDRSVAAMAGQMEMRALQEAARQRRENNGGEGGGNGGGMTENAAPAEAVPAGIQAYRQMAATNTAAGAPAANDTNRRLSLFA